MPVHCLVHHDHRVKDRMKRSLEIIALCGVNNSWRENGSYSIKRRIDPTLNTWEFLPEFRGKGVKAKNSWREYSVIL